MKPRRYQERAIENFLIWSGKLSERLATIILPTGVGKTATARWGLEKLYENARPKVLWGAHREELIDQAADELSKIPGLNIEIEMAARRASADADIVVGSVQTLYRNRKNLQDFIPEIVIIITRRTNNIRDCGKDFLMLNLLV
jgi:superfamily II DNA or RNA helicase